jgi:hypothetical protein
VGEHADRTLRRCVEMRSASTVAWRARARIGV